MRHVILASAGTYGDVFPFVALGSALRSRGNRITLAANEQYRQLATDHGFEFAALVSDEETLEFLSDPHLWHPVKCGLVGARWAVRCLHRQYQVLSELASNEHSVLAASPAVIAARLVQEKLSRPLASVYYTPWMIPSCTAPPAMTGGFTLPRWAPRTLGRLYWRLVDTIGSVLLGRHLNQLRASLGLKPVRRIFQWWLSPQLAIGMFPEWYAKPQPDWPSQLQIAGFPTFGGQTEKSLDARVLEFCRAGDPPIVFTFGTGMMHAAALFREAMEACRVIGARGILLTEHRHQLPDALPAVVRHFGFVPLQQLLPKCAAVVHHGGIGTVATALSTGTPQLVIPHAWDQLDNARRVIQLGAGEMLKRRRSTGARIARALVALMNHATKTRCREIANRSDGEEAMKAAAQWIEQLGVAPCSSSPEPP